MKVTIILSHPTVGSFNHAIAQAAADTLRQGGHHVILHDLHAEQFDPVYTADELAREVVLPGVIEQHCREMGEADGLVVVHPNYWSRPPAMMCGWVDRVLRPGRAYRFVPDGKGSARPVGLLRLKAALVFNTANTPQEIEEKVYGDPLQTHWAQVVFGLCGTPRVVRCNFTPVILSSAEQRGVWLQEVKAAVTDAFPPHET